MGKLRVAGAYVGLTLLFVGWAAFLLVFIRTNTADASSNTFSGNLETQRMAAIEEAKRQGKREYSFTTDKVPVPIAP